MSEEMIIQNNEKPKNKKKMFLLIAIIGLIAIAIGLYVGYRKVMDVDSSKVVKDGIEEGYNYLVNKLDKAKDSSIDLNIIDKPVSMNLKGKLNSNLKELEAFTDFTYDIGLGLDLKNDQLNMNVGVSKNSASLNLNAAFLNHKGYLKCDELFDKVLDLGDNEVFENFDLSEFEALKTKMISIDDLKYLLKSMKDMLVSNITNKNITSTDETFTVEGKEYKGKKIVLHIDTEFKNQLLDKMLQDDKMLDVLSKVSGAAKEDIKLELEDLKKEEVKTSDVEILTNKSNKIVSVSVKEEGASLTLTNVDSLVKLELEADKNSFVVTIKDELVSFKVIENGKELFVLESQKDSATIKINIEEGSVNGNLVMELKNINTSDKEVSADINMNMNIKYDTEDVQLGIDGTLKVSTGSLSLMNVDGAVSVDSLTEDDQTQIMQKLTDILEKFELTDLLAM